MLYLRYSYGTRRQYGGDAIDQHASTTYYSCTVDLVTCPCNTASRSCSNFDFEYSCRILARLYGCCTASAVQLYSCTTWRGSHATRPCTRGGGLAAWRAGCMAQRMAGWLAGWLAGGWLRARSGDDDAGESDIALRLSGVPATTTWTARRRGCGLARKFRRSNGDRSLLRL